MEKSRFIKKLGKNKYFKFIYKHWKFLCFIVIGMIVYAVIHEVIHYFFINYLGYSAEFCWTCIPTSVNLITPLNEIIKNHYFIFIISPHFVSVILISLFLTLFLIFKNKYFFYFSIIPFLDVAVNTMAIPLAFFTNKGNDFLNLFRIGYYWEVLPFIFGPLILFFIIWICHTKFLPLKTYKSLFI